MSDSETPTVLPDHCIYCLDRPQDSADHVFPQFLGGKQTIPACTTCNNRFGHTFEAAAARDLQALQVFIATWGIRFKSAAGVWRNAFSEGEEIYNLSLDQKGVTSALARPVVRKDETGEISSGVFQTEKQLDRLREKLLDTGRAKGIDVEYKLSPTEGRGLSLVLPVGEHVKRTALKMCIAASKFLPDVTDHEVSQGRCYLTGTLREMPPQHVLNCYQTYANLDRLRTGLSHIIYIERRSSIVFGVVQFFGTIQQFCYLGWSDSPASALLCALDPVIGTESISEVEPLRLIEPPFVLPTDEAIAGIHSWTAKLQQQAIERGATHPPKLEAASIEFS